MSYIGSTPTTQSFISGTDYFNGTGAQTAFTLTRTVASVNDIEAVVNNVVQQPNDAYTISGTTITFTSAPSAGTSNVYVRYLSTTTQAISPSQGTVGWAQLNSDTQQDLGISFKNRIINGDFKVSQYNGTSAATITGSGSIYAIDRFSTINSITSGTMSVQQSTTAPVGFATSFAFTNNAAVTASAGQLCRTFQGIEGNNFADLNWGSANAKTVTVSFWVRSSLTGTYAGSITNGAGNRAYVFTYTISATNTWEQKSVTIAGDTGGTWIGATNACAAYLIFDLGSGSNSQATAGSWQTSSTYSSATSSSINWAGTNGATFYLTGVMLEVGTQATTFDNRSYGTELSLCQRYYISLPNQSSFFGAHAFSTNRVISSAFYPATMRATPTVTAATTAYTYFSNGGAWTSSASGTTANLNGNLIIDITVTATSGSNGVVSLSSAVALSAEL